MARKPNRVVSEPGTGNICPELWAVSRSNLVSERNRRATSREFRFLAILDGIHEVSHGMEDSISVSQAGVILGIRYADQVGDRSHRSWVLCPICPSTVQALAKAGEIIRLGHNRYDKQSVVDRAELVALRKRKLEGEFLHENHPSISRRSISL